MAEEDRAGIVDPRDEAFRVGDGELEVLGGDVVGYGARLVEIAHPDQRAAIGERCRDDFPALHAWKLALHAVLNRVDQRRVGREQDRSRDLVVLSLGKRGPSRSSRGSRCRRR